MENNGEIKVKSLQKALEILNCFAVKQPLGVTEISEKLGLYKSNVHNILVTFTCDGVSGSGSGVREIPAGTGGYDVKPRISGES